MHTVAKLSRVGTIRIEPSEDGNPNSAHVYLECLARGSAQTLGVALRRTLLYAVPGSGFTSIQIDGASHEFANISGVKEDVIDIVLNLKRVVLDRTSDALQVVKFQLSGPRDVKAGDLEEFCDGVKIVNKDHHLLTITDAVTLNVRMTIESGCGYTAFSADGASSHTYALHGRDAVGVVSIDACFCPVERVSFDVGHSRLGGVTDYDRLHLFIETNGAVAPDKAVYYAAKVLKDQLSVLAGSDLSGVERVRDEDRRVDINGYLNLKIEELELSVRSQNCLKSENIIYLGDLVQYTEMQMLKMPNFGKKSLMELKNLMAVYGLNFGMKVPDWARNRKV